MSDIAPHGYHDFASSFLLIIVFSLLLPVCARGSSTVGTIDPGTSHYAWNTAYGWVNFAADQGNIQVTDSRLTGYAWGQNIGWINLAPINSSQGVINDGSGNLSGFAWSENFGWVDFQHVVITTTGRFTGYAENLTAGQISFDCTECQVQTDWRPISVRGTTGGGTTGGGNETGGGASNGGGTGLPPQTPAPTPPAPQPTPVVTQPPQPAASVPAPAINPAPASAGVSQIKKPPVQSAVTAPKTTKTIVPTTATTATPPEARQSFLTILLRTIWDAIVFLFTGLLKG